MSKQLLPRHHPCWGQLWLWKEGIPPVGWLSPGGQAHGDLDGDGDFDGDGDEDKNGDESNDNDIENTDLVNGTWPDYLGGDDEVSRRPAVYPLLPLVVFFLLENIVGNFIVLGWWFRELGCFIK